jgi:hypothetical protein
MVKTCFAVAALVAGCAPVAHPPAQKVPTAPTVADLVQGFWRDAGVKPAPPASDGAFLRRVTLDLAGRIPTLAEAHAFLADAAADKRARLVDRLLASRELAEHWGGDVYADLLFGQEGKAAQLERRYDPAAWLVQAFAENRPYDRLATELITATGDVRDNGAVAFVASRARGGGGAEAVAGATARIFLGLQIQCAQCHDHPYDPRWKQEDFYGLVAFFARTKPRNEKLDAPMMVTTGADAPMGKAARTVVLIDTPRGEAKMRRPHSEDEVKVGPRFLGHEASVRPGDTRRRTLARAIVASDLFAKAMVARTWAQLLGHGLVDPWDDLGGEDDPRHPPLLRALAADFVASGYDVRRLIRTIVLSPAYDRSAGAGGEQEVRLFARSGVRPLSPDSLFRTLVVATGAETLLPKRAPPAEPECVEAPLRRPRRAGPVEATQECKGERKLRQVFKEYQFVFGDDEMAEADRFDGSVPQSLLLWNGELTNSGAHADRGGVLAQILAARQDPEGRLDDMFLAAYTRQPTADERRRLLAYLRETAGTRAAYEDLYFALVTSTEAITNH